MISDRWQVPNNFEELQKADVGLQPLFQKVCEVEGNPVGETKLRGGDR